MVYLWYYLVFFTHLTLHEKQGDWGSVGETVIPGCSLWFTLSVWESLLKARHLFRPDEIISATDVLPGMQVRRPAGRIACLSFARPGVRSEQS